MTQKRERNKKYLGDKKILVTGGNGFVGRHVVKELVRKGVPAANIFIPSSKEWDLRERKIARKLTKDTDIVIHLAGNVGGIGKNQELPGTLFYDNAIMGIELIEAARVNKVEKFVCIGTICAYPKYTPIPFNEDDLWLGYPEETNAPYGLAKKMLLVQLQAYRQQFGFNGIYILPVNMYGPGDNFDPQSSHVIPALIKKVIDAKEQEIPFIEIWGDGTPTREFLYVEDAARGIVLAAEKYNKHDPVNLGAGFDISIKELASLIGSILQYKGEFRWNTSKPNGQPKRLLSVVRAEKEFHFQAKISFENGLKKSIEWYIKERRKNANVPH